MFPFFKHNKEQWQYSSVPEDGGDMESVVTQLSSKSVTQKKPWKYMLAFFIGLVVFLVLLTISTVSIRTCYSPKIRREWRTMARSEQQEYIISIQCLMDKPSLFEPGTSLWDDFAYAHTKEGTGTHYTGAFLTWHRYFLHVYEVVLVEECGFKGAIPYWDWSLDSNNLTASPIWDNEFGFGGDGKPGEPTLARGRCVEEGPFANTTRYWQAHADNMLHVYNVSANPHCFSRGFATGNIKERFEADITPDRVNDVLAQDEYDDFFTKLELGTHNAVPQFISGDFYYFTAPNDPVFYLHHAQIDRMWWLWQQRDPKRFREVKGSKKDFRYFKSQKEEASLDDVLSVAGFGDLHSAKVSEVMDTEGEIMCYRY